LNNLAAISIRVNADVDASTLAYISTGLIQFNFGVDIEQAPLVFTEAAALPYIRVSGIDCHIGSQLTRIDPYIDTLERLLTLLERLSAAGIGISHLDLGGGLGIRYRDEIPPLPADQASVLLQRMKHLPYEILIEPGRAIVGNAGILLTRVELLKHNSEPKHFAVVDAAMNDLLRPALYSAWQEIIPVHPRADGERQLYDIVGPVCESADFLGKERELALLPGDLLAVRSAGAYGFVMSSNYNTRPRAAEVMVDGDRFHLVRARERIEELYAGESLLPG
jgi:diaminopimelate decarboxylase